LTSTLERSPGRLRGLLRAGQVVVLSGAGISTDSGIPDYRGPTGSRRRHTPMTYQAFMKDPRARHRYWARSFIGWTQIASAQPNAGHVAVAALQAVGTISTIITQNVDGLHQAAGAGDVVELHGGLDRVVCLNCTSTTARLEIHHRLLEANPDFHAAVSEVNPDGDAALPDDQLDDFVMISCPVCDAGPLKPDVVFFGESVPRERVQQCYDLVEHAQALLVLGSSLKVMSGYRFVRRASELGIPVAIINQGPTRGDDDAEIRVDAPLSEILPALAYYT
jgi:NAD-dependent SIR2 family protein deacetylase